MTSELDRINTAVRECLNRCYSCEERPVVEVGNYLIELRGQSWGESDVSLVRATVAKILRQLAGEIERA
jgi:hypothetical protein